MNKKNTLLILIMIVLGLLILTPILSSAQVERINVLNIVKNPNGYIEVQTLFKAKIPTKLTELPDFVANAQALYGVDSIEVSGSESYAVYTITFSMPTYRVVNGFTTVNLTTQTDIRTRLEAELSALEAKLNSLVPLPFGTVKEQVFIDSTWITN
jgi:hypothetical protein